MNSLYTSPHCLVDITIRAASYQLRNLACLYAISIRLPITVRAIPVICAHVLNAGANFSTCSFWSREKIEQVREHPGNYTMFDDIAASGTAGMNRYWSFRARTMLFPALIRKLRHLLSFRAERRWSNCGRIQSSSQCSTTSQPPAARAWTGIGTTATS